MALRTQAVSANTTNVAITAATTGDLILVFAYNNASTTIPTLATNFTSLATQNPGGSSNASRVGYKISTGGETSSGTWTTATNVVCHVYRGTGIPTTLASTAGNSAVLSYGGGVIDSGAWVAGFGGAKAATAGMTGSTTTLGNRTSQTIVNGLDSNTGLGAFSAETLTVTTSGRWVTETVEIPQAFQADDSADGWIPPVVVTSILALLLPFSGGAATAGAAAPTPVVEEYWQAPAPPLVPVRVWFASDDDPVPPQPVTPVGDEGTWPLPVFLTEPRLSVMFTGPGATGPTSATGPVAVLTEEYWRAPPPPLLAPWTWLASDRDPAPVQVTGLPGDEGLWPPPIFLTQSTGFFIPVGPGATAAIVTPAIGPPADEYQWPALDDTTVYESRILTWWSDGSLPTVPVEPDPWVAPLPVPQPRPVLWATDEAIPPQTQPPAVGDDAAWSLPVFVIQTTARLIPLGPGATDATVTAPAVVDEVYWWGGIVGVLLRSPAMAPQPFSSDDGPGSITLPAVGDEGYWWRGFTLFATPGASPTVVFVADEELPGAHGVAEDEYWWTAASALVARASPPFMVDDGELPAVTPSTLQVEEVYAWGFYSVLLRSPAVPQPFSSEDGGRGIQSYIATASLVATGLVTRTLQTRLTRARAAVGVVTHATQFVRLITRALVAVGVPHRILQTQLVPRALVAHGVAAARRQTQVTRALLEFAAVAAIRQTRKTRALVATGLAHLATTRFTMVTRALIAHGVAAFNAVYLPFSAGLGNIYVNILRRRRRKKD